MQGFVNFASDIGYGLTILLPALCHLFGASFFILAGYGGWQCTKPGTFWASHRYLIPFEMLAGTILLSFDRFLNSATTSFGGGVTASLAAGATSYTPPVIDGTTLIGNSPEQTMLNLVNDFAYFFMAYGAFIVFLAVLSIREVGKASGGTGSPCRW